MARSVTHFLRLGGFAALAGPTISGGQPALGVAALAAFLGAIAASHAAYATAARRLGLWNPAAHHLWLWLPWRALASAYLRLRAYIDNEWRSAGAPTGGFAGTLTKLCLVFRPGDVLLGRLSIAGVGFAQPVGQRLERHLFMLAGTGGGKTSFLTTMLALHPGNAFVIDPKGKMAETLRARRGGGGDGVIGLGKSIAVLDPYGIVPNQISDCWNPLTEIETAIAREGPLAAVRYADKLAEGLIRIEGRQPYFPRAARKFLSGLVLYVLTEDPPPMRTMLRVHQLVNAGLAEDMRRATGKSVTPQQGFQFLLQEMARNTRYAAIASAASVFSDARSAGDVMAGLKVALSVYDNDLVRAISAHSTFSLHDLKLGRQDVFVCAPTGSVNGELSDWFRLLTVMSLAIFESVPGDLKPKCFFAIDELPSLGAIEKLDKGPAVLRSYGVQFLGVAQTLSALSDVYPKTWRNWLGNADAVYWMATNDDETAQQLAETLGRATGSGVETEVLTADQIKRYLDPDTCNVIVTRFGKRALKLKTSPYFRELPVYYYTPDGDHRERPLRRAARALMRRLSPGRAGPVRTRTSAPPAAPAPRLRPTMAAAPATPVATAPRPPGGARVALTRSETNALAMFALGPEYDRTALDGARAALLQGHGADPKAIRLVEAGYRVLERRLEA
ncbi:type IV secretory system conjugative DNA transfer family protein [Rubrimonas cliftonensis]|uniref:Type IV secretory pathway, VirD4 component, TraG/TraD family ATPase n=1 Tax=Rubrimonas cliftonensis TaxID=89524 RepID=A0A1H3VF32_9RHOB|nr:type IV secretory system conjugative DNA transfer family protein [Rubrimonas cliftonensis]SDZ73417.1 Type IV secretory pathway, VirD4 component, TraG/TraD family ATPase [Rubrimonas cliftonensis]